MELRKMSVPTWLQAGWQYLKVVGAVAITVTFAVVMIWAAKLMASLILRSATSLVMELNSWPNGHSNLQLLSAPGDYSGPLDAFAPLLEVISIVLSLILGIGLAVLLWAVFIAVLIYICDPQRK